MRLGQIILLNGTSSAGKSTLAKALQAVLPEPYLHIGIDTMIFALPKRYLYPPLWHDVFQYTWPPEGSSDGLSIEAGPLGHQLMSGLHHAVAALAHMGNNVIVDHVLLERQWVWECAYLFGDLPALFVGVYCPLEIVEQRERDRQDRTIGQARAQFDKVHAHDLYDIRVDTSKATPEECAAQIVEYVRSNARSSAFVKLRNMKLQAGVFPIQPSDFPRVVEVWEASVRATHYFVSEADIQFFRPLVQDALPRLTQLACVRDGSGQVAGFVAVVDKKVEMLFIDPSMRGQGAGRRLLSYAIATFGATTLDVNEQNEQAVGFYLHMGFEVASRSALDSTGKPYPLLHLRLAGLAAENSSSGASHR